MKHVALITGCSKGIGREIALELARDGFDIIGTYNTDIERIKELKVKIDNIGVCFDYYKLDLTNNDDINEFLDNIRSKYSKIDLLINNASLSLDNEFEYKTKEEFMIVLEVNLVGPFVLIQGLIKQLDGGMIINISSTDGISTYTKLNIDYSASKAGLINLTKSLSLILENVKIYAICPNWVNTESIREMNIDYLNEEMKRIGQYSLIDPKEISNKVLEIIYSDLKSGSIIIMEG